MLQQCQIEIYRKCCNKLEQATIITTCYNRQQQVTTCYYRFPEAQQIDLREKIELSPNFGFTTRKAGTGMTEEPYL